MSKSPRFEHNVHSGKRSKTLIKGTNSPCVKLKAHLKVTINYHREIFEFIKDRPGQTVLGQ